jgi:uridylate kinase
MVGVIRTLILVALLVEGVAAQPPMGRGPLDGKMAPHQMMGMMQQMASMMNQMAALLRAGQLTRDQQVQMADLMAEMAEMAHMAEVAQMMDRINTIICSGAISPQAMTEIGAIVQEMGKRMQQMAPLLQHPPLEEGPAQR